jgi:hypothetical protein
MTYRTNTEILAVYKPLISSIHRSEDIENFLLSAPKTLHKDLVTYVTKSLY